MKNLILVVSALSISVSTILYTQSHPLPAPYYGVNPDTQVCTQGTLQDPCENGSILRCRVTFGSFTDIEAFDTKSGSICAIPVYKTAKK